MAEALTADGEVGLGLPPWALFDFARAEPSAQLDKASRRYERHVRIGLAYAAKGDLKAAIGAFRVAAEATQDPVKIASAKCCIGRGFIELGRYPEAIEALREAIRFCPEVPIPYGLLALALTVASDPSAADACRDAIQRDQLYVCFYFGVALEAIGDLSDAADAFRVATRLHPKSPEPQANLAAVLVKLGKIPEAIGPFQEALKFARDTKMRELITDEFSKRHCHGNLGWRPERERARLVA